MLTSPCLVLKLSKAGPIILSKMQSATYVTSMVAPHAIPHAGAKTEEGLGVWSARHRAVLGFHVVFSPFLCVTLCYKPQLCSM